MKKVNLVFFLLTSLSLQLIGQLQIGETLSVDAVGFAYSSSVSSSSDGSRIAVGGYGKSDIGFRIYDYDGDSWNQIGNDINTIYPKSISSYKVDLSSDGNRIVTSTIVEALGFVRVYELYNNAWTQIGNTIFGDSNSDIFGLVIAISADGQRISASAKFNNNSTGQARVYEYDGNDWVQLGSDIVGDKSGDYYATSLSMSADGNRVAVGANQYYPSGLVRVFEFNGADWSQLGDDLTGENDYDNFGVSSSLSQDGNRIIIGDSQTLAHEGYVKMFDFNGTNWIQIGDKITGSNIQDKFGMIVSISDNGNRIAVGAPSLNHQVNTDLSGYVKVYRLHNSNWKQHGITLVGEKVGDEFGRWLSISADGSTLITGALKYVYLQSETEEGYAKVYDLNTILSNYNNCTADDIIVYPNPSNNYLFFSKSDLVSEIIIHDVLGQIIKIERSSFNAIDISDFNSGLYFINFITFQNQMVNRSFIKK